MKPFGIVRMNFRSNTSLSPVIDTHAEVVQRHAVRIEALTRGPEYGDKLRCEVQHLAEFQLLFLELLLGLFTFFNFEIHANPIQ